MQISHNLFYNISGLGINLDAVGLGVQADVYNNIIGPWSETGAPGHPDGCQCDGDYMRYWNNVFQDYGWKNTGTLFKSHMVSYAIEFLKEELDQEIDEKTGQARTIVRIQREFEAQAEQPDTTAN